MSDDPSLTSTTVLLASLRRDIAKARADITEAWRFLEAAEATAWELERREALRNPPPKH